jgi:hypothetical protein
MKSRVGIHVGPDINTIRKHYIVPSVEMSRRVARQRVAHRQAKRNTRRNSTSDRKD